MAAPALPETPVQAEPAPRHGSGEPKQAPEQRRQPPAAPVEGLASRLASVADKAERVSVLGARHAMSTHPR